MKLLKNYRLTAMTALLLMSFTQTYAHAVVTHSSLNITAIAPHQATQVELTFNSKVELDLSQIYLVRSGDKMQMVDAKHSNKPGQIIISIPSLIPGEYALKLKIFAADGHLSEDLVRFHVTPLD